jgi:hypothetical protein
VSRKLTDVDHVLCSAFGRPRAPPADSNNRGGRQTNWPLVSIINKQGKEELTHHRCLEPLRRLLSAAKAPRLKKRVERAHAQPSESERLEKRDRRQAEARAGAAFLPSRESFSRDESFRPEFATGIPSQRPVPATQNKKAAFSFSFPTRSRETTSTPSSKKKDRRRCPSRLLLLPRRGGRPPRPRARSLRFRRAAAPRRTACSCGGAPSAPAGRRRGEQQQRQRRKHREGKTRRRARPSPRPSPPPAVPWSCLRALLLLLRRRRRRPGRNTRPSPTTTERGRRKRRREPRRRRKRRPRASKPASSSRRQRRRRPTSIP